MAFQGFAPISGSDPAPPPAAPAAPALTDTHTFAAHPGLPGGGAWFQQGSKADAALLAHYAAELQAYRAAGNADGTPWGAQQGKAGVARGPAAKRRRAGDTHPSILSVVLSAIPHAEALAKGLLPTSAPNAAHVHVGHTNGSKHAVAIALLPAPAQART